MKLLLDEMYSPALVEALKEAGVQAVAAAQLGLAGRSDDEVFAAALDAGLPLLTENVSDFVRISSDHLSAGGHHAGLLIALSSRFSRRASGIPALVAAIRSLSPKQLGDRVVYLESAQGTPPAST